MKILFLALFLTVVTALSNQVIAQTTAFNFQGRLNDGSSPANGRYDLQFKLFDAITGGNLIGTLDRPDTMLVSGVFSTALDFGGAAFTPGDRFIEISLRPTGSPNPHVILGARQQILSVPLAVRATNAATADNSVRLDGVPAASFPRLDTNGFLGIGETNPFTRLAIGDGALWTNAGWKSSLALNNGSAIGWQANASGQQFGIGQSGGGLYFFRTLSPFGNISNPANYDMVISDAGSVGIGTTAPQAGVKLDVLGTGRFQLPNANIQFGTPNFETGISIIGTNRADMRFSGTTLTLAAGTGTGVPANTGIAVTTSGNAGIGTLTPVSKLDVRGDLTLEAGGNPAIYTSAATGEQNRFLNLLNSIAAPSASGLKAGGVLISDDFAFANPGKNDLVVKGRTTLSSDPSFVNNFNVKLSVISSNPAGNAIFALGANAGGATDAGSTIVGTGGNSGTGRGGNGASFLGGNSAGGGGGNGVVATGGTGNSSPNSGAGVLSFGGPGKSGVITVGGDGGGGGVLSTGGISNSGEGGVGGIFRGGDSTNGRGGFGLVVNPGSGTTGSNSAAVFNGNVSVNGTLSKFGGSFKIDHPLDPANKYLYHSFVESPDMMNVYNGNTTTDENGEAIIRLPDYFEALNRDYRYQLTVIGQFAQAIVAEEIKHSQFKIKTDKRDVKVSWQVTGIRQDAYANANRIPVEEKKPQAERGSYLYPQAFDPLTDKRVGSTPSEATPPQTKVQPE